MNRISGLEKSQAPWHLRWFYTTMRKMFGKDLPSCKIVKHERQALKPWTGLQDLSG